MSKAARLRRQRHARRPESPLPPCLDCATVSDPDTRILAHEGTCPIQVGLDAASDGDRAWFETHPDEVERLRPATRAEWHQFGQLDPAYADAPYRADAAVMCVQYVAPGLRIRALVTDPAGHLLELRRPS